MQMSTSWAPSETESVWVWGTIIAVKRVIVRAMKRAVLYEGKIRKEEEAWSRGKDG